eukprot:1180555-Prorocentrum_minimum.AAC.2
MLSSELPGSPISNISKRSPVLEKGRGHRHRLSSTRQNAVTQQSPRPPRVGEYRVLHCGQVHFPRPFPATRLEAVPLVDVHHNVVPLQTPC